MNSRCLAPLALALGSACAVPAQDAVTDTAPAAAPVDRQLNRFLLPPGEPGYRGTLEVSGTYVPGSGIRLGSAEFDDLSTTRTTARYLGAWISGGPVNWSVGGEWERFGFDTPANSLLPDSLQSVTLSLGVNWRFGERWAFLAETSPGIYSDFEDLSAEDLNAPTIAGLAYAVSARLQLFFQLSIDPRRDIPVVGGPGVRWQFADQWALSILLPRPRIEYQPNRQWLFYAGGEIVGGAYQLGESYGTERGRPDLDDTNMTYREIRAGAGAVWTLPGGFRLEGAGGWTFDRRFVVDERNLQWNGDGAPYFRLFLSYRY
jgi:hypothetical protein